MKSKKPCIYIECLIKNTRGTFLGKSEMFFEVSAGNDHRNQDKCGRESKWRTKERNYTRRNHRYLSKLENKC